MNDYETLRQLADSIGLTVMAAFFVVLCLWPFRPGSKNLNNKVANSIFEDTDDVE